MLEREIITKGWKEKESISLQDYLDQGGFLGLKKALSLSPKTIIKKIKNSNLKGRSGSAFPTGIKWEAVFKSRKESDSSFIIANGHEGEPFTFKDWYILKKNPYLVIEGMLIAAYTLKVEKGFLTLNHRYFDLERKLKNIIKELEEKNFLGKNILGKNFNFEIEITRVLPYYICGEETALVNYLENKRPEPRRKPPYLSQIGYLEKPTLVNNIETFANIPLILRESEKWFSSLGDRNAPGTKLICFEGDVVSPGIYEVLTGSFLDDVIYKIGGGVVGNSFLAFVGGLASGTIVTSDKFKQPLTIGCGNFLNLGIGTIIVFNKNRDVFDIAENLARFLKENSCGHCASCREGMFFIYEIIKDKKTISPGLYQEILDILETIEASGFCNFAKITSSSLGNFLKIFKNNFVK